MKYEYPCPCGYMSRYETDTKAPASMQCNRCKTTIQRKGGISDDAPEKDAARVTVDTATISTNGVTEQPVKRKRGRPPKVR